MDVEVELHSHTGSNQVDLNLSFILCTDLTYSQVDAEIEVAGETEMEQDTKEAKD